MDLLMTLFKNDLMRYIECVDWLQALATRGILTRSVWRPKFCQGSGVLKKSAVEYLSITFIDTFQQHLINTPATPQLTLDRHSTDVLVDNLLRVD